MARNGSRPPKKNRNVRVRSRPLDQVDAAKAALALTIMARRLLEERDASTAKNSRSDEGREVA